MIKEAIVKIVDKQDLTYEEAYQVMNEIMNGETSATQNAAFLAASKQEITGMEHIMTALQQEYEKSGKILGKAELQEYYIYKI